ncbi:MAG: hypothetical protein VW270_01240 [Candidatus Poseidoniales archaeon]
MLIGVWFNTILNLKTYMKNKKRTRNDDDYETEYDLFFTGEDNMRKHESKFDY